MIQKIPPVATWAEYQVREFAEVEVVYSSLTYLYDALMVVKFSKCQRYIEYCYGVDC